jgi:diguanylate cyclase (GGDEF)-like protein
VELPAIFQLELADSYLSIGVVTALAFMVIAALGGLLVLRARLSQRTREMQMQVARRLRAETQLLSLRDDLENRVENRVRERTLTLQARIEELGRERLKLTTANRRLRRLVAIDPLTGIANRRQFDRVLDREVRRARRELLPLSLIFLDLDDFKLFNDTHGHAHGDDVLRRVARALDESFRRGGDLVARYGGEEFAVILPGVDACRASLYAERLRRRIWRLAIATDASGAGGRITISAGVATVAPDLPEFAETTPEALLLAADQALYRAKAQGRNRVATTASRLTTGGAATAPGNDGSLVELAS